MLFRSEATLPKQIASTQIVVTSLAFISGTFSDKAHPVEHILVGGSICRRLTSNMDMKRVASIGAVGVGLGCVCVLAAAQGVLHKGPPRTASIASLGNAQSNIFVIPSPGSNSPVLALPLPQSARLQPPALFPTIPARVYQTAPYSCIVVVPGPQPDDRCVIHPPEGVDPAMPIIRPTLRFIPRDQAGK